MLHRSLLAASALVLSTAAAQAQSFAFQVSPSQSSVDLSAGLDLAMPGTVIGNFDATTNPTGTSTLPGLFGGIGNQPVPMSITLQTDVDFQGSPTGAFQAQVDVNAGTISVTNFALDALGGQVGQTTLTLELLYQTFRTFNPNSLFFGGIPLPLPLGQGTVSGLTFVQNGPALGVLVAIPRQGSSYDATVLVPTDVTFTIDVFGQITPVGPLPFLLPLTGTLSLGGGSAQLALVVQQSAGQTLPDPFPGQAITDLPLPVPTILPPGGTANLLFNAIFSELVFNLTTKLHMVANGTPICDVTRYCPLSRNSAGNGAVINVLGSASVGANNMAIRTSNLPPNRISIVLFGDQPASLPFYAGRLCVGGTIYRLPVARADSLGVSTSPIDFAIPSPKYQALVPGSVWHFQCLYRDPSFAGPPGNTSEALRVQFCP